MVRLKRIYLNAKEYALFEFQSHFGSIKTHHQATRHAVETSFNPTLVRLKPGHVDAGAEAKISFNPTLVRLKHWADGQNMTVTPGFQSHFGSIKTQNVVCQSNQRLPCFNPTLVRLKRVLAGGTVTPSNTFQSHFGSIKTSENGQDVESLMKFQSHFGSIKTGIVINMPRFQPKFQSHFGSIKTLIARAASKYNVPVSIPLWFD